MIWFGGVLWHINHYRLFNAKSSLYMYGLYTTFTNEPELVCFYTVQWFYIGFLSQ